MGRSTSGTVQLFKKFPDAEAARLYIANRRWPRGTVCPACGEAVRVATRRGGFYRCNACRLDFTVRTGTILERSHVPLHKWLHAMYLLVTARKSISSVQLAKEIGITQKSAWFVLQRIRETCRNDLTITSRDDGALDKITDRVLRCSPKARLTRRTNGVAEAQAPYTMEPYAIHLADAFAWLKEREPESIHAIVTDPPYGVKEYSEIEKTKLRSGRGGVWRIPPSFDGFKRSPVPRFTVLDGSDLSALRDFFKTFGALAQRALVPGGHIIIAANPLLSHLVYLPLIEAGFEKRGEIIRLVQTLRGGDRPKNAHDEFSDVSVMPRSAWEPWGLFRKPCEGRVQDNLRKWGTGGFRRLSKDTPFGDVICSSPTRAEERKIAPHPSLKPQAFMRQVVRAALPLGRGVILDPFMGGGSTIAAAVAVGYQSIGIEMDPAYFATAKKAIPALAQLKLKGACLIGDSTGGKSAAAKGSKRWSHSEGG